MTNNIENSKQFILNLYNVLIESNLNKPNDLILEELQTSPDPEIDQALNFIRQVKLKTRATGQRSRFNNAIEAIEDFRKKAGATWESVLGSRSENEQLLSFFRKYDQVGEKDKIAMLQDKHILDLIKNAKDKIDKGESTNGK